MYYYFVYLFVYWIHHVYNFYFYYIRNRMDNSKWRFFEDNGNCLLTYKLPSKLKYPEYFAMFDLDGTLIVYKRNILWKSIITESLIINTYHTVKLAYNNVIDVLRDYNNNNYTIVIMTNQAGIATGQITIQQIQVYVYYSNWFCLDKDQSFWFSCWFWCYCMYISNVTLLK